MKVTRFPLLVFSAVSIFALFTATSCKKSSSSSSGNSLSATISTSAFNPSTTQGVYSATGQIWDIAGFTGKSGDTTGIEIIFFSPITLNKAFKTDTTAASVDYLTSTTITGKDYDASQGNGTATLTITSLDTVGHKISGTFTGVLYASSSDSVVVTNGKFSTSYTPEP